MNRVPHGYHSKVELGAFQEKVSLSMEFCYNFIKDVHFLRTFDETLAFKEIALNPIKIPGTHTALIMFALFATT